MLAMLVQAAADQAEPWSSHEFVLSIAAYAASAFVAGALALAVRRWILPRQGLAPEELGQPAPRPWWSAVSGVLAAWAVLLPLIAVCFAAGAYHAAGAGYERFTPQMTPHDEASGWLIWGFFLVQSSSEEFLFRGIGMALMACLLAWLIRLLGTVEEAPAAAPGTATGGRGDRRQQLQVWFYAGLAANVVVSVGFASVHSQNEHVSGLALLNIALAGLAIGQLYWLQGSLLGACVMHAVWNATIATFGLPVSGYVLRSPLLGGIRGSVPGPLTGGSFGPEASVLATAGLALLWLWLVWRCWIRAHGPERGS